MLADVLRDEAGRGAAVLFSSHQLDLVEDVCEDVAIVDHGRVVATGDVHRLRGRSHRRRIELRIDGEARESFLAGSDVDPERVLAEAEARGPVVEFSYGPPSLAELFLELVDR